MRHLLAAAFCILIGCVSAPKPSLIKPSDPAIRYGGYFDARDLDAPRFAWPGTHFALRFSGTSLRATLSSTPLEDETRETDSIAVVIDGGKPKTFALSEGRHVYQLASGLTRGSHRVLIWKRTEAEVGTITFHGLALDDGAHAGPPLPAPTRRIIFIGDSITAGYGAEGTGQACTWSAATENNFITYGAVAARALEAEYVATAWSGKGVWRNFDARDRETMPQLYQRVIPTDPGSANIPTLPADAIVVNLGTNDFGQGVPEEAAVIGAFAELLDGLRARYPSAFIVLALGPMLIDEEHGVQARSLMRAWLEKLRAKRSAQSDDNVALLELWTDPAEGLGCDSHPNEKTHARIGAELADTIRKHLHW